MARLPPWQGPAFLMLLLLLFGACRSPAPEESERVNPGAPAYGGLDPIAREAAENALQETLEILPSESTRRWKVDSTGISGSVTPLRTFRIKTGHFCREFQESIARYGEVATRIEVACRKPEGGWIVVQPGERRS